ncbi:MAG: alpha/beta hydrolase, partial [Agrococcus sp.]
MTQPASLPPEGLPGLDPHWSRLVAVPGRGLDEGVTREWHCIDTADALARIGAPVAGTILAVHGNPTWSYLWRSMAAESVAAAQAGQPAWRVVAVDQLEMGFSERTGVHRPLPQRVLDLAAFTDALGLAGPVVTLGHDWGGVISLGWAVDHPERLAAVALLNTAVHHPAGVPIPAPLRLARARGVLAAATVGTTGFLETTLTLATPALAPEVKDAFRAPYRSADRRHGIGGFVADIPVDDRHESFAELERISWGVARLEVPALLQWGPEDPVFTDRYLDDLVDRLPHADVHRYEGASHLVAEERPYAGTVLEWLSPRTLPLVEPLRAEGAERVETDPDPLPLVEPLRAEGAERVETGPDPLPLVEPLRAEGAERVETDPESSDGFDSVSALRARTGSTGGDGDGFDSVSALRARTGSTGGVGGDGFDSVSALRARTGSTSGGEG